MVDHTSYVTAVIAVSGAFMATAGVIMGIVGARDTRQESFWNKKTFHSLTFGNFTIVISAVSVILGVFVMVYGLSWLYYGDGEINWIQYFLAFQFAGMFLPLFYYVMYIVFGRKEQPAPVKTEDITELKKITQGLTKIAKELKAVSTQRSATTTDLEERFLFPITLATFGVGISLILYSADILNQGMKTNMEGPPGIVTGVVGILLGIFVTTVIPISAQAAKRKREKTSEAKLS